MRARALRRLIPPRIAHGLRLLRAPGHGDDRLRRQLDAVLAGSVARATPSLVVVPTTGASIGWARGHASAGRWLLAERRHVAEACSPSRYLAECARLRARGQVPPHALLFSDQFVEAPHAVLLAEHDGQRRYLSAVEVVAQAAYGIDVHWWTGDVPAIATSSVGDPASRLLEAQAAYLAACHGLGDAWRARGEQALRHESTRRHAAIQRVRRYESYLLQAFPDSPMDRETRCILRGLAARRRGLLAQCRADAC